MMKCLSTRRTAEGTRRRYARPDGSRLTTIEVPIEQWLALTGRDPAKAAEVRASGVQMLTAGVRPKVVAAELGVTLRLVYRWAAP